MRDTKQAGKPQQQSLAPRKFELVGCKTNRANTRRGEENEGQIAESKELRRQKMDGDRKCEVPYARHGAR